MHGRFLLFSQVKIVAPGIEHDSDPCKKRRTKNVFLKMRSMCVCVRAHARIIDCGGLKENSS